MVSTRRAERTQMLVITRSRGQHEEVELSWCSASLGVVAMLLVLRPPRGVASRPGTLSRYGTTGNKGAKEARD